MVAAEDSNQAFDAFLYEPGVTAARRNLKQAGETGRIRQVVADAGYWSKDNVGLKGVQSFIAPGRATRMHSALLAVP